MKVFFLNNYYNDGYEYMEGAYHGCIFSNKEQAEETAKLLIEMGEGQDDKTNRCDVIEVEVYDTAIEALGIESF